MTRRQKFSLGLTIVGLLGVVPPLAGQEPPASIVPIVDPAVTHLVAFGDEVYVGVQVLDAFGQPIDVPSVVWEGPRVGPRTLISPQSLGDGISALLLAPVGGAGAYDVTARVGSLPAVVFHIRNDAPAIDRLETVGGSPQSTLTETPFPEPLAVRAMDAHGPLAGVTVTFVSTASGLGILDATQAVTGIDGIARVGVTATAVIGQHAVRATATGPTGTRTVFAQLVNLDRTPAALLYVSGDGQATPRGGSFAAPLVVQLLGNDGLPLADAAVDFVGPAGGPGIAGDRSRVLTDGEGQARVSLTANTGIGAFALEARALGSDLVVPFTLTIDPLPPAVVRGAGSVESRGALTTPGGRFNDLEFQVLDGLDLPAAGVEVTLEVPASGPSAALDQSVLVTDQGGWVRTGATANAIPGTYSLRARVQGVDQPGFLILQQRPAGYAVGESLADVAGPDETGTARALRGFLDGGRYLLLDVCTLWCAACRGAQGEVASAVQSLAADGIDLRVVPLLMESSQPGQPSTQANAAAWRTQFNLAQPVLHVAGQLHSPIWEAGWFVLGPDQPAFPTYLLVGPDGTVLARRVGALDRRGLVALVKATRPKEFRIVTATPTVAENAPDGEVRISVLRSGDPSSPAAVTVTTVPGSASTSDFEPKSFVLHFAAGADSDGFGIPITNDGLDEPNEQFQVVLSAPEGAAIAQGSVTVTVVDDDAPPNVSIFDARAVEGSSGGLGRIGVPVRLDRASGFEVRVKYAVVAGSATDKDVRLETGTVVLLPGQLAAEIGVSIVGDKLSESKETFSVSLESATSATIVDGTATVTIVDDDGDTKPPVFTSKADVMVEVKTSAAVAVKYDNPEARDAKDGVVPVLCAPPSGGAFAIGKTAVTCTAEDKAGNQASLTFLVIVQAPTVPGAIFDRRSPTVPLTEVKRGQPVVVRVGAGGFSSRARVELTFVDSKGRSFCLEGGRAERDGSLDLDTEIPHGAAAGSGQLQAETGGPNGFTRAWLLTVVPREHDRPGPSHGRR